MLSKRAFRGSGRLLPTAVGTFPMPGSHRQIGARPVLEVNGRPTADAEALPGERLTLEVVTQTGRAACVEVRLRAGRAEIWHHRALLAVFDREILRKWLGDPGSPLASETVTFSLDRMVDVHGRVAISLPDVHVWTLSPTEMETLQRRV